MLRLGAGLAPAPDPLRRRRAIARTGADHATRLGAAARWPTPTPARLGAHDLAAPNSAIATRRCPCSGSSVMPWAPPAASRTSDQRLLRGRWDEALSFYRRRRGRAQSQGCARGVSGHMNMSKCSFARGTSHAASSLPRSARGQQRLQHPLGVGSHSAVSGSRSRGAVSSNPRARRSRRRGEPLLDRAKARGLRGRCPGGRAAAPRRRARGRGRARPSCLTPARGCRCAGLVTQMSRVLGSHWPRRLFDAAAATLARSLASAARRRPLRGGSGPECARRLAVLRAEDDPITGSNRPRRCSSSSACIGDPLGA